MDISFGQERQITRDVGKGLEDSLKRVKKIDRQIATALTHNGFVSHLQGIPYVRRISGPVEKLVTHVKSIKPLPELESELRGSLNNSLISLVKVGKRAQDERERISQLGEIYDMAVKDEWGSKEFIEFIENNSDINYVVSADGEEMDMKDLFAYVDSHLSDEKRAEKTEGYKDWLGQHINLSQQYLDSMHALCFVGSEWVEGMTRSYFDLTQLRGGMEDIQRTLRSLDSGGTASLVSQQAIRQYGTAYVEGMRSLLQGYHKMCDLKDKGSTEFRTSLDKLKEDLSKPRQRIEQNKPKSRLIINSR